MKKLKFGMLMLGIIALASACTMNNRHVVITDGDNYASTKIEYWGKTYFSSDGTTITHISKHGSVKYEKDGQELVAESKGDDQILYRMNDEKVHQLNDQQKAFLAHAVKDMIRLGHNKD